MPVHMRNAAFGSRFVHGSSMQSIYIKHIAGMTVRREAAVMFVSRELHEQHARRGLLRQLHGLSVAFSLLFFVVHCVDNAALVNTLKALCILHSHEKLLSQVLKGLIGR